MVVWRISHRPWDGGGLAWILKEALAWSWTQDQAASVGFDILTALFSA